MQAVIFDMDGTLMDSALLTIAAFRRIAPGFGLPVAEDDVIRGAIGYANPEFYERIYPEHPVDIVHRFGEAIEEEELSLLPELAGSLLFPGCAELLEALRSHGYLLYIASTGSGDHVCSLLDATGARRFFDGIHCGQPEKTAMIRQILAGRNPGDFVVVGDRVKDSAAARANGIVSVGACYGYCPPGGEGFDCYVHSPGELARWIMTGGNKR